MLTYGYIRGLAVLAKGAAKQADDLLAFRFAESDV